ncbi:MFS transporter [Saccharothrix variisporea]|uniref:Putative MFS family arabinose efflux permease n=1 Tax=Saccharothrix variisporea TaxID=543527 RepID=A0A495XAZ0_9PSEU|nr:MFS transporter [Saccharothrix variisporea]RKT69753.1 putative MFS family arabinose efflux permease [Saccharothrix variisporea]
MTRAFLRFWAADTVSLVGTHITTLALGFLAMDDLGASDLEVGLLRAAPWVPYLLFGLMAGVVVDRYRRRPILVGADLARCVVLGLVPVLHAAGALTLPVLYALVTVFGGLSLVYDAAHQSFLPKLVPATWLTTANARMEQTRATAQSAGPTVAGWLITAVGAPAAILVDAVSYLVSGLVLATIRVEEQVVPPERRNLRRELREGLAWVYRHPVLRPLAVTSHAWFLFAGLAATVFLLFGHDVLGFSAFELGIAFAVGGVGTVVGASLSDRAVALLGGPGGAIVLGRWLTPVAYALVPFAGSTVTGLVLLSAAQLVWGFGVGVDSPPEMGYRQAITPDHLQGRMNATIRSLNRAMIVVGAPLGGLLADLVGHRTALWVAVTGLVAQAVLITRSPVRTARA